MAARCKVSKSEPAVLRFSETEIDNARNMSHQKPYRVSETLLLSTWTIGYHTLIRLFSALQWVERLSKGLKRKGQAGAEL
jgi:hypothetical protein